MSEITEPLSRELHKGIPRDGLNNAADRGTATHSATEPYLDCGAEGMDESLGGYLEAFKDFAAGHDIKPMASENAFITGRSDTRVTNQKLRPNRRRGDSSD